MKLLDHVAQITQAYDELYYEWSLAAQLAVAFSYKHHSQPNLKPRYRAHPHPPKLVPQHEPMVESTSIQNKETLLKIAVFQATYQDLPTPMTPDMVLIIIDTGASISISPYASHGLKTCAEHVHQRYCVWLTSSWCWHFGIRYYYR